MSHLFLTGFMGAGKSTVGRLVARTLGLPFVDLDDLVEERAGRPISAIFSESGEEAFRCAETDALTLLEDEPDAVVACGGGIVLREENRLALKRLGRVLYLKVTAEEALARVGESSGRPLLEGEAGRMASTLLSARSTLYEAVSDETIDTTGKSAEAVSEEIVRLVHAGPAPAVTVGVAVAQRPYDAVVGRGVLSSLGGRMRGVLPGVSRAALVADSTTGSLFGDVAAASLRSAGIETVRLDVPAGEESKSWERAGELLAEFVAAGLDRTAAVVALGGGVVGDLAGFCASVYLRGVPVVQVPTTLLAQVDSSIGGKTGVDLPAGKNLVGAFWQPSLVVTDTSLLASLPEDEWRSGLAEVAKTGVLAGEQDLAWMEAHAGELARREADAVSHAVETCVHYKASVVAGDERESGARECLNLGHTLAHAVEKVAGFGVVPHGRAVAEGMRFAARLAQRLGLAGAEWTRRQEELLDALGLPQSAAAYDAGDLLAAMRSDKKARGGRIRFAFATAPGICETHEVDDDVLADALHAWAEKRG